MGWGLHSRGEALEGLLRYGYGTEEERKKLDMSGLSLRSIFMYLRTSWPHQRLPAQKHALPNELECSLAGAEGGGRIFCPAGRDRDRHWLKPE